MKKRCKRCKKLKSLKAFYANKASKDLHMRFCKLCSEEASKRWDKAHPERKLLRMLKSNAKRRGITFALEESDIKIPKRCPILGFNFKGKEHKNFLYHPSVDRKNTNKGYIKGNIQIISGLANAMKSLATPKELRSFADWINKCYGTTKKMLCKKY